LTQNNFNPQGLHNEAMKFAMESKSQRGSQAGVKAKTVEFSSPSGIDPQVEAKVEVTQATK